MREGTMGKARILVVESNLIIAHDIRDKLKGFGYDVVPDSVRSGQEALTKAEEMRPDLVLMDITLEGGMDDINAAEQIWQRFNIPTVFIIGRVDEVMRAVTIEPFAYVLKPFVGKDLHTAIKEVLLDKSEVRVV